MEEAKEVLKENELNQDDDGQVIETEDKSEEEIETDFSLDSEENIEEESEEEELSIEEMKAQRDKALADNENYKKALKANKAKTKTEPKEDVRAVVEEIITNTTKQGNEAEARNLFLKEHPEYTKTSNWNMLRDNYASKGGVSTQDFLKDLERADALVRLDRGELTPEYQEKYMQNRAQAQMSNLSTVSAGNSSRSYTAPEFSNEDMEIMKKRGISGDSMKAFNEEVASGKISY